jgi:hypothetical protein
MLYTVSAQCVGVADKLIRESVLLLRGRAGASLQQRRLSLVMQ